MKIWNRPLPLLSLALALITLSPQLEAQETTPRYRLGFTQAASPSTGWGAGLPYVTSLSPESAAARAGLQLGDLLLSIDGVSTSGLTAAELRSLLQRPQAQQLLQVRRLGQGDLSLLLQPELRAADSRSERELALAFALYSPEDVSTQSLSYQISYQTAETIDYTKVRSFAFAPSSAESKELDEALYSQVAQLLTARGLHEDSQQPDLLIECFYELQPLAEARLDPSKPTQSLRYLPQEQRLSLLPIIPHAASDEGAYQIKLSLQISRPQQPQQPLWIAESREGLSEAITLKDFARYTLPLMLQSFPYSSSGTEQRYDLQLLRYLYTGLHYSLEDLSYIAEVSPGSPAAAAGLKAGDRIRAINGLALSETSPETLAHSYKRFIKETEEYREPGMLGYWNPKSYAALRKTFESKSYASPFSYLFAFRPYIKAEQEQALVLDIERAGERYTLLLQPELRQESTLTPLY